MKDSMIQGAIAMAERRWLPDSLLRRGIDVFCHARLHGIGNPDAQSRDKELHRFIQELNSSPIALMTDRANEQHYEVPAGFFERVLGAHLKYSCCYWDESAQSLSDAERAALKSSARHADLQDGMDILELGCGWGSFSLWMAEHYPNSRITAVSNSHSQRLFIEEKAKQGGITNLAVVTADMNDFSTDRRFDRVVSIEMFEHMRNYQTLFRRIAGWLKQDGRVFVHVFCHRDTPYLFEQAGADNWMGKYFFSGGLMPSEDLFSRFDDDLQVECTWRWNGKHYEKTANAWLANLDARHDQVLELLQQTYGDDAKRWLQRWRMFFMACAQLFGYQDGEQWYVCHYRLIPRE